MSNQIKYNMILKKRGWLIISLLVVAVVIFFVCKWRRPKPNGAPADVAKFMMSEDFAKLPSIEQKQYYDSVHRLSPVEFAKITAAERERINGKYKQFKKSQEMNDYFAASGSDARNIILDKIIDEKERKRLSTTQKTEQKSKSATDPESMSPSDRASLQEFKDALRQRRIDRGMPAK